MRFMAAEEIARVFGCDVEVARDILIVARVFGIDEYTAMEWIDVVDDANLSSRCRLNESLREARRDATALLKRLEQDYPIAELPLS